MHIHRFILLATLFVPLAASAQTLPPRDPDAAARAAREANNPLRVIIEASKLKVRATEAPAPEKRPVRPAVTAKPATAVAAKAEPKPVAAASQPTVQPTVDQQPAPTAARVEPTPVALIVPAPVVPAPVPKAVLLPLKLSQMVEPALPASLLRRMLNDVEVIVGFTVNADGSVSNVAVRSNPIKGLEAPVIEAISQWRYEPIHEARAHAVQLVLRTGR